MLSELIEAAIDTYDNFGDMPVFIDRECDKYEYTAVEMRREIDRKTQAYNFVVADYIYKTVELRLVK
jgi:hypothetical protein